MLVEHAKKNEKPKESQKSKIFDLQINASIRFWALAIEEFVVQFWEFLA